MLKYTRKLGLVNKNTKAIRVNVPPEILQILGVGDGDDVDFNITDKKEIMLTKSLSDD